MQVCTSLQTNNHASTSPLSFFTGRMPFLPPDQQRQSTEEINLSWLIFNHMESRQPTLLPSTNELAEMVQT